MNLKAERLLAATEGLPEGAVLVEIGCVRTPHEVPTDGWSTFYLACAARKHGWEFHSVDNELQAVENAQAVTGGNGVTIHWNEGTTWLSEFEGKVDFLYLDGSSDPDEALAQYLAAPLALQATIVIDDVQPIGMQENGKGDALLDFLAADGYRVEISETEPGYRMAVAKC